MSMARFTPEDGDVVIREAQGEERCVYILRTYPGPDQLLARSREEAVAKAVGFAKREHVRVWLDNEADCTLLEDFRIPGASGATRRPFSEIHVTIHRALEQVRAEFLEMPGLRLTAGQLARLCGLEPAVCKAVLDALVDAKFLRIGADGTYARLTDGHIPSPHPAKAEHPTANQASRR
jgi:hypothetical protein